MIALKNVPWKLKSLIFKFIDLFSINWLLYFIQNKITSSSRKKINEISDSWILHRDNILKYNISGNVFEFGAGNSLIQNIFLSSYLSSQYVIDINPMLNLKLVDRARVNLLSKGVSLKSIKNINTTLDLLNYGINYLAPCDASKTNFPNSWFDACISTDTLEHIPVEVLPKIFDEVYRILKPEGLILARIDYSDHYAYTDKSISPLNFLKFTDNEWALYNHNCHYQNRLRHSDYLKLLINSNFEIVSDTYLDNSSINISNSIMKKYSNYPNSWLALSGYIVARRPS